MDLPSKIAHIEALEEKVREYINTTRYQNKLIRNGNNWNQICCSLDTIGDSLYAIQSYVGANFPEDVGLKYIFTYGLLQALFIQQDAVLHLSEAFNIKYMHSETLKKIRMLRNAAIGHPTKQTRGTPNGITYYNYISRITLSHEGFTLMQCHSETKTDFIDVELIPTINDQLDEIIYAYGAIANTLEEADKMHKDKFKSQPLHEILHSSMNYLFEKIAEGIHTPEGSNRAFAISMLGSAQKTYKQFEDALRERGDISEYTEHDLAEYNHALCKLAHYLSNEEPTMVEYDARIYLAYVRSENENFRQLAKEIDDSYQ